LDHLFRVDKFGRIPLDEQLAPAPSFLGPTKQLPNVGQQKDGRSVLSLRSTNHA